MLSDFVKVIMCNISMRMMLTMAKLVFLAPGVYFEKIYSVERGAT